MGCRFGLVVKQEIRQKPWMNWLMITTGIAFILPLFGLSYWIALIACVIAIYCIFTMTTGLVDSKERRTPGTLCVKV